MLMNNARNYAVIDFVSIHTFKKFGLKIKFTKEKHIKLCV